MSGADEDRGWDIDAPDDIEIDPDAPADVTPTEDDGAAETINDEDDVEQLAREYLSRHPSFEEFREPYGAQLGEDWVDDTDLLAVTRMGDVIGAASVESNGIEILYCSYGEIEPVGDFVTVREMRDVLDDSDTVNDGDTGSDTESDDGPTIGTPEQWRENVPERMQEIDRWLMWSGEPDTPRRPHWRGDFSVSYNDPDEWHTFDAAVEAAAEKDSWGIGFVTGEDVSVIDLDGIKDDDGGPVDWAPKLGRLVRAYDGDGDGPYAEWSPSGTGQHIPVAGMERPEWWSDLSVDDREHEGVDLLQGQFVTVTGDVETPLNGDVLDDCPAVKTLLDEARENIESLNGGGDLGNRDSMETLLRHASVNQDMGRKRPTTTPCHRARNRDWSVCEGSRVMGVTARVPRPAAPGKARIGASLLHALASRVNRPCTSELMSTNGTHRWQ